MHQINLIPEQDSHATLFLFKTTTRQLIQSKPTVHISDISKQEH